MKRVASVDPSVLKQHYEKKKGIEELRYNLENISSTSGEGARKLKEDYLQKLNVLESQKLALMKHSMDNAARSGNSDLNSGEPHVYDLRPKVGLIPNLPLPDMITGCILSLLLITLSFLLDPTGCEAPWFFTNPGTNSRLLVDMDTSESEHSDVDAAYDDDDTEWEATEKRLAKKRNPKTDGRLGSLSDPIEIDDSGSLKTTASDESNSENCFW
ncbi:hypothetical protein Vadar_029982 [Vaccinium darrowii]|uniref:Uncharacterized protein n=1 Tax=Vaccinium darrowii TaxID=229202 RepID=A0ACB7YJ35_9ERIC|nr:hypothetical protein Vadar_029982 [Vaccinium darrowii]